ncbi:REST corepressor isoform X3 [Drosophila virilis]|uniref:Uncharacterized protein, isoform F n=1 Tax=Drosophila virilis TaxID=7244 RepID=B4MA37_DROVI|nr:REST corepressor isoform X3 [Drosophila virilis]EDW66096.2 uncharacterized protein Dvir_GJ15743, isoform F [Drosophila virilis]
MVLAERNTGDIVRNGRRSRGPSPNTHTSGAGSGAAGHGHNSATGMAGGGGAGGGGGGGGGSGGTNSTGNEKATANVPGAGTPESSDDDNSTKRNGKSKAKQSEYEEKIRVGRDYQAVCPQLVPELDRRPELMNERALLVWSPTKEIPDMKLEEYISVAKEKYGYNGEQALGMLFWHKHDLERAVMDLANFTPFPDEWTIEDKVLFDQAFQFHGKSFHRIRQMLPDKSIASLVKYYYSWKKTRHRSSAMDRQEKMIKTAVKDGSENGSEVGSNEESDNDDKIQKNRQMMEQLEKDCSDGNVDVDSGSTGAQKTTPSSTETAAAAQPRISARWTSDEIEVALLALRDYGKNFPMIAKVVGTKTEAHVRTFYVSNRRRYNLDQIVKEYEAKSEDSNIEEQCDAAPAAGAAATTATAATAAAGNLMEGSKSETSDATSQELAKKEEPMANANSTASSNSNNNTTKKKPELMNAAIAALKSSECASSTAVAPLAAALAAATASGTASVNKAATLAIGAPTITIVDESDTATSSSSDLANSNNNMAPAAGSNSVSSLSGISSSNSSSSSSAAPAKSSTNNNHNDADSEESLSLKSSAHVPVKRDNSDLNTGELPPAKKMALAVGAEFLAK